MIIKVLKVLLEEIFAALCDHWQRVLCFVAGVLTVVLLLLLCDKPAPQPTTSIQVKYDTIRTVDTITRQVPLKQVVHHYVRDTVVQVMHDTLEVVTLSVVDSVSCVSGDFYAPDSAKFSWSACSRQFPMFLNSPIKWDVKYLPAPKIEKTVTITDTILLESTKSFKIKSNTAYVVIGAVVGMALRCIF